MRSIRGTQAIRRRETERSRLYRSFPRFTSLLLILLWSRNSSAFHQRHPLHQRLAPTQPHHSRFPTKIPSSSSFEYSCGKQKPVSIAIRVATKTPSLASCTSNVNDNQRFRRRFVRRAFPSIMLLLAAGTVFPGWSLASEVVASTAPALPPQILTCPVSAATEYRLMVRLVIAALIGAALGKERSFAKHSAGVRTMSLVSMGAAVFTVCSGYGFLNFPRVDASRMAANVASGVGFVGAGVITTSMRNQDKKNPNNPQNNVVHGLTTAATIWLSAAVGVACGVGLLRVATTAAFTTIAILRMGRKKKKKIFVNNYRSERQQQQQRNHFKLNERDSHNPITRNSRNDDYVDDFSAEVHETSDWDEHHDHEPDEVIKETLPISLEVSEATPHANFEALQKEQAREIEINQEQSHAWIENLNSTVINDQFKDPSDLMEEIVRSAWQNDSSNVTALVDLVLNRVEKSNGDYKRKQNSGDDGSSSSNSNYLP